MRMDVSWRQAQRSISRRPSAGAVSVICAICIRADTTEQLGDQRVPRTGDQQHPDDDEHAAAGHHHGPLVAPHPAERVHEPLERERGDDERQAEPEAVDRRQHAPRAAVPSVPASVSTAPSVGLTHGIQPSPNKAPSSGAIAEPDGGNGMHLDLPLQERHEPHEDEAQDDDHDAHDDRDRAPVLEELAAERAEQRAAGHEDGGEAEHEQRRAEHHPAAMAVVEVLGRDAGDVGEVAGQQRDDARGEEGHEAGQHGDRDREQERARRDGVREVLDHRLDSPARRRSGRRASRPRRRP